MPSPPSPYAVHPQTLRGTFSPRPHQEGGGNPSVIESHWCFTGLVQAHGAPTECTKGLPSTSLVLGYWVPSEDWCAGCYATEC